MTDRPIIFSERRMMHEEAIRRGFHLELVDGIYEARECLHRPRSPLASAIAKPSLVLAALTILLAALT